MVQTAGGDSGGAGEAGCRRVSSCFLLELAACAAVGLGGASGMMRSGSRRWSDDDAFAASDENFEYSCPLRGRQVE